jgi:hypothetical protein
VCGGGWEGRGRSFVDANCLGDGRAEEAGENRRKLRV